MEIVVIIIVVLFIGIIVLAISGNAKKKQAVQAEEKKLKASGIELTKKTATYHGTIGIDESSKKLVLIQNVFTSAKVYIINFSDVYGCELIKDGNTVFKKSAVRTIGGAVIGGALTGGVGAIVGGLSGSSKSAAEITKVELKIVVRDLSNPTHKFVFFDKSADHIMLLNNLLQQAEMWKDTISLIIDMEDNFYKQT